MLTKAATALSPIGWATLLSWAGLSSAAQAQSLDILADFRIDRPSATDGFVTVRERPQPLYNPVPMRLGSVEVMPRVSAQALYDSNIFVVSDAEDDAALHLTAAAEATQSAGNTSLAADALIDRRQYLENDEQSTTDYWLGAAVRHALRRDSHVLGALRIGRETESLADPSVPLNTVRPSQYDFVTGSLGAGRTFNRLLVAARASVDDRSYKDGLDALGNPIEQNFRNRLLAIGEIAAEYDFGPRRSVFAQASFNRRDYRNQEGPEPIRDSSGYRVEAGASFMLTPLIRSRVSAGYFRQDFKDPLFESVSGLAVRGRFDYLVTPLVTLTLTGSRGVEESSTIGTGAYVADRVGVQADYELLRNLIVTATTSYERDRFEGLDRRYSIKRATVSAQYRLSPRLRLDAEYEGRDQDSVGTSPGRDFVRHQLTIGLTIQGI
ncbi:outer membrane beta-barrel protein [Sphingosinicella sp. CPCC 101087]|uniref:outer membrane beta-barrel protein n=1 Tax=Sphingosinicella sp. CPCC 101087 TaxID=2497754 RepID=UPI00101C72A9|nr:outer membrane beta-barrel protein [Sphingosinicella sp. CPCC 101087]